MTDETNTVDINEALKTISEKTGIPYGELLERLTGKKEVEEKADEAEEPEEEEVDTEITLITLREDESTVVVSAECKDRKTLDNLDRQTALNLILASDTKFAKWINAGIEIDAGTYYYDPERSEAVDPRSFKGATVFRKDFKLARLP